MGILNGFDIMFQKFKPALCLKALLAAVLDSLSLHIWHITGQSHTNSKNFSFLHIYILSRMASLLEIAVFSAGMKSTCGKSASGLERTSVQAYAHTQDFLLV